LNIFFIINIGIIKYFGKIDNDDFKNDWIGIEWEKEQTEGSDGRFMNKRYFQTKNNYSSFLTLKEFNEKYEISKTNDEETIKNNSLNSPNQYDDYLLDFIPKPNDRFINTKLMSGAFLISDFKILKEYRFETIYDSVDLKNSLSQVMMK
jgi:hypothetical protein